MHTKYVSNLAKVPVACILMLFPGAGVMYSI